MNVASSEAIDLVQKLGFPVVIALGALWAFYKQNNRFVGHLEKTLEKQDTRDQKFGETLTDISSTMKTIASHVPAMTCKNFQPKRD